MSTGLAEAVLAGEPRAIARAITLAETGGEEAARLVARLRPVSGRAQLVGLTGAPGAGKSSLIGKLAREFRSRGRSVGILAVDPSSPVTGGAVLGDRVRMQEVATDAGVFVRSMASRGRPGGLAPAIEDAAVILGAAGYDVVLLETVGVGQGELDVANVVQTVVVVLTPGMGDEIQSLKAGLLEIAHIYVVNKSDLVGADAVARSLHMVASHSPDGWLTPVLQTSTVSGSGVQALADAIYAHREHLSGHPVPDDSEVRFARSAILSQASREILADLTSTVAPEELEQLARQVVAGALEPAQAAREIVRLFFAARVARGRQRGQLEPTAELDRAG